MARPRRVRPRVERAKQAAVEEARAEAINEILGSLKEYLPAAAATLGKEAKKGSVTASTTILKFVAENSPRGADAQATEILAQVMAMRAGAKITKLDEELEIPKDIDVEAELDGAKVEAGTNDQDQDRP
jgi:hypothetical protein